MSMSTPVIASYHRVVVLLGLLQSAAALSLARVRSAGRDDRGQSTAEYALVILGAAAVALLLIAWASQTDKIGQLLDSVIDSIISRFR